MANQFEEFTPVSTEIPTDNLSGARAQQYSPEAASAMSSTNTAASHLPEVSFGEGFEFVSAIAADGPGQVTDNSLNGQNPHQAPAELGNAHNTVELIQNGGFQNPDGTITAAGQESIRAAVAEAGNLAHTLNPFQSYEARTRQVQDYINRHVNPPISLSFNRDTNNASTALGAQPFISVGPNPGTRIPLRR